jgi:hypothetical protein
MTSLGRKRSPDAGLSRRRRRANRLVRWLAVSAIGMSVAAATAQPRQVPDPAFDARVADPAFPRRHPRALFDEAHHNVHRADSTYRAFAQLVRNDGVSLSVNRQPFTAASLAPYRVLVIAGPLGGPLGEEARARLSAFTEAEIRAVVRWVRAGGGLLLLTDHEPVASASAALVEAFRVTPSRSAVVDRAHAFPNFYPTNILATAENGLLRRHPVSCGVDRALVFGGQSLHFAPDAVVVAVGGTARGEEAGAPIGNGQVGAFRYGRGRVVITGDMGMLSAQLVVENDQSNPWGMNVPGIDNRQLVLNMVRWLAGHPSACARQESRR